MNFIDLLKYVFLGLIQGFTEPLPISSSGHLVIMQKIFNLSLDDLNYEIILNFGSLLAILFFYRKDIIRLITNFFKYIKTKNKEFTSDFNYCLMLVIATIPAGIVGLLLKDIIEQNFKSLKTVGISLLITALALFLVNKQSTINKKENISFLDALVIGVFQVFALIPGISRSGSTMVGGLSRKINIEDTLKFSFLMYIPISIASLSLGIFDILTQESNIFITGYIAGFFISIFATYFAIKWFIKFVKAGNLKYFSYYCVIVGTSVIFYTIINEII